MVAEARRVEPAGARLAAIVAVAVSTAAAGRVIERGVARYQSWRRGAPVAEVPPPPELRFEMLEPGRGRAAKAPVEIPHRGWWDILTRVYVSIFEDRILTLAAGVAFYSLLALFPALTVLVSLYGLFADPSAVRDHLYALSFMLPEGTFQIVEDQISRIVTQGTGALTLKLAIGFAIALWGANAGMKSAIEGLNAAYREREKRSFLRLNLMSLTLTVSAIGAILVAVAITTVAPAILSLLSLPPAVTLALEFARWPVAIVMLTLALSVLYRYGPSRTAPRWRWVTLGSVIAALLWLLVSLGLSWYLSSFADYDRTYGSLGAVVAMMMWMWLSTTAVLVGAEINAEMEHQTACDTTVGPPKPLGARGAYMADTVGRSATSAGPPAH